MVDHAAEKSVDRRTVLRKIGVGGAIATGGLAVGSAPASADHHCESGHEQQQAHGRGGDLRLVSDLSVKNCDQGTKANDLTVNISSTANIRDNEPVDDIKLKSTLVFNGNEVNLGIPPTYEETSDSTQRTTHSNSHEANQSWNNFTAKVKFFNNVVLKDAATFVNNGSSQTISNRIQLSPRPVKHA